MYKNVILLCFLVLSCNQLADKDGNRKVSNNKKETSPVVDEKSVSNNKDVESDSQKNKNELFNSLQRDSCAMDIGEIDVNIYLDSIDFPLEAMTTFLDTILWQRKDDFLVFQPCDYKLFNLHDKFSDGLNSAAYISDYGYIYGNRLVLLFVKYPNRYLARLVTLKNGNPIDKINAAHIGFRDLPCDIEYKGDSIFYENYISKFRISNDTIEAIRKEIFKRRDLQSDTIFTSIGRFNQEVYHIDTSGRFIKTDDINKRKKYMDSLWVCY